MLRRLTMLTMAALLAGAGFVAVLIVGMRTGSPRVLGAIRRLNRAITNPLQLRSAGTAGAYASVIRHRGRVSGRTYDTPVVAVATDDGFVIALPYGRRTDWLQNVLATGTATIVDEGQSFEVARPEVVPMEEASGDFSVREQRTHSRFGVRECLRVRRVEAAEPVTGRVY